MGSSHVTAFLVAVVLIWVSPGPAMMLVLRRAALQGFRTAITTVLGLEVGLYCWALAAGAGLAAVVAASALAYDVLRLLGAGFLLYLGVRAVRSARAAPREANTEAHAEAHVFDRQELRRSTAAAFVEGLIVQLANPKAALLLFALYPQFMPSSGHLLEGTALLALLQVSVEAALYSALIAAVGRTSAWFQRPKVRRRLDAASGAVLIALGVRVAVVSR